MSENIQELISLKGEELFNLCDKEQKGYIIKKDIQRLQDELDVEPGQLEDVFDSLDIDHNGFLTLQEFTCKFYLTIFTFNSLSVCLAGFGMFISNQMGTINENEHKFHETLEALGAKDLYDDEETIMGLWTKLRETDPTLLRQFEEFIGKITEEIKRSKFDHRTIEAALQTKSTVYDDEIKRLYEEMEQQIKFEKAKVLEQVIPIGVFLFCSS